MTENEGISILSEQIIQKKSNNFQITLTSNFNSIIISVGYSYNIYESKFNLEYLQTFTLFNSKYTIKEIMQKMSELIDKEKIKIKEKESNLILIFDNNVKLNLKEKKDLSKEIIKQIMQEEIKNIKDLFKEEINKLNNKIKLIEEENKNQKEEIKKLKEENERIKSLENTLFNKDNIQLTISNLKNINSFKMHKYSVNKVSIFNSGNIISVSEDKSIKIYDNHFNILQDIQNAHNNSIFYVDIKDENNFITSSINDIKSWIKENNLFKINKNIKNAHSDWITKAIYYQKNKIISCSWDKTIKIWKENIINYKNIKTITHSSDVHSMLLLEDKNILVFGGVDGIQLLELNNYKKIIDFKNTFCGCNNSLCRINEDNIIVPAYENKSFSLKIISISLLSIIKQIDYPFSCWGISFIKKKGIIITGGKSKNIITYRSDNYECILKFNTAHNDSINGFIELKDGTIASFSRDSNIKIWSFY